MASPSFHPRICSMCCFGNLSKCSPWKTKHSCLFRVLCKWSHPHFSKCCIQMPPRCKQISSESIWASHDQAGSCVWVSYVVKWIMDCLDCLGLLNVNFLWRKFSSNLFFFAIVDSISAAIPSHDSNLFKVMGESVTFWFISAEEPEFKRCLCLTFTF